jgi:Uma2 family endonuclease
MEDMTALPKTRLTVDQYLAWAEDNPGRYELVDGEVFAMSPEGTRHAEVKFAIQTALVAESGRKDSHVSCFPTA